MHTWQWSCSCMGAVNSECQILASLVRMQEQPELHSVSTGHLADPQRLSRQRRRALSLHAPPACVQDLTQLLLLVCHSK